MYFRKEIFSFQRIGKSKTERGLFVFEDVNDEEEEQQWMQGV